MKPSPAKKNGPEGCSLSEPVQTSSPDRKSELNIKADITPQADAPAATQAEGSAVESAAIWLADEREPPNPAVPALRQRFGLSAVQACEAIALARKFQTNRRAFG